MEYYRGDIFYVKKWGGVMGSEQESGRPAVIVSSNQGNQTSGNVTVVYLTTQDKKPLMTHVEVLGKVKSTALCETVCTVSKERLDDYVRTCTDREMKRIDEALMIALGIGSITATNQDTTTREAELKQQLALIENESKNLKLSFDELVKRNEELQVELKNAEVDREYLQKMLQTPSETATPNNESIIKLETERDLYKSLYEQMLAKMIER